MRATPSAASRPELLLLEKSSSSAGSVGFISRRWRACRQLRRELGQPAHDESRVVLPHAGGQRSRRSQDFGANCRRSFAFVPPAPRRQPGWPGRSCVRRIARISGQNRQHQRGFWQMTFCCVTMTRSPFAACARAAARAGRNDSLPTAGRSGAGVSRSCRQRQERKERKEHKEPIGFAAFAAFAFSRTAGMRGHSHPLFQPIHVVRMQRNHLLRCACTSATVTLSRSARTASMRP